MNRHTTVALCATLATLLFAGCNSSSTTTPEGSSAKVGYFIDAPVAGAHYKSTSGLEGKTDAYGRFRYREGDEVAFSLGKIDLGKAQPEADGKITPETLVAGDEVPSESQKEQIVLMLQLLQALDSDDNATNGITISESVLSKLTELTSQLKFDDLNESALITLDNAHDLGLDEDFDGKLDIDCQRAKEHFEQSKEAFENGHIPDSQRGDREQTNPQEEQEAGCGCEHYKGVRSNLTEDLKRSLITLANEAKMAYDLYMKLYSYHQERGDEIEQFYNIAQRSEVRDIATVQQLLAKYQLDSTDLTKADGQYGVAMVQERYDQLLALGQNTKEDALKVGCQVEVNEINDLNTYIKDANLSRATDVEVALQRLREGSYSHYWAFDKALKEMGVAHGCFYEGDALLTDKTGVYPEHSGSGTLNGHTKVQWEESKDYYPDYLYNESNNSTIEHTHEQDDRGDEYFNPFKGKKEKNRRD